MSCWLRLSVSSDRRDRTFRNLPGAPKRQLASVPFKNGAVVEQSRGAVSWTEVKMSIAFPECDPPAPSVTASIKLSAESDTLEHPIRSKLNLRSLTW